MRASPSEQRISGDAQSQQMPVEWKMYKGSDEKLSTHSSCCNCFCSKKVLFGCFLIWNDTPIQPPFRQHHIRQVRIRIHYQLTEDSIYSYNSITMTYLIANCSSPSWRLVMRSCNLFLVIRNIHLVSATQCEVFPWYSRNAIHTWECSGLPCWAGVGSLRSAILPKAQLAFRVWLQIGPWRLLLLCPWTNHPR